LPQDHILKSYQIFPPFGFLFQLNLWSLRCTPKSVIVNVSVFWQYFSNSLNLT
jgi:hypothetical protein